jgi:uncharacterized protein with HEPN domain
MDRDEVYLVDIVTSAKLARSYVADTSRSEFMRNVQVQDAVIRRLEIIGEAARRLADATKAKFPSLPWRLMIRMRNIMIHEYDGIDLPIVWETVTHDLPLLIAALEPYLPLKQEEQP